MELTYLSISHFNGHISLLIHILFKVISCIVWVKWAPGLSEMWSYKVAKLTFVLPMPVWYLHRYIMQGKDLCLWEDTLLFLFRYFYWIYVRLSTEKYRSIVHFTKYGVLLRTVYCVNTYMEDHLCTYVIGLLSWLTWNGTSKMYNLVLVNKKY